jgi:hypothetical protein
MYRNASKIEVRGYADGICTEERKEYGNEFETTKATPVVAEFDA